MSNHPQRTWTTEQEAELTRLWNDGYSAGVIGGMMGKTRNAIISKGLRLDLRSRPTLYSVPRSDTSPDQMRNSVAKLPNGKGQPKANAIVARVSAMRSTVKNPLGPYPGRRLAPTPPPEPFDMEDGDGVDVSKLLGIMDNKGCKWISGDPLGQHGYCGKPFKPGSVWCSEHHARVYPGRRP